MNPQASHATIITFYTNLSIVYNNFSVVRVQGLIVPFFYFRLKGCDIKLVDIIEKLLNIIIKIFIIYSLIRKRRPRHYRGRRYK